MPLRLKALELHGYKTFAAKTSFVFAEGITAIVGPNGSGKSNIADSLRWVLGEQSYSLLRAKKTEDMIFAGSEQRPRAGMASAGVTFDNTSGWLPVDFTEVALARRSYRDGRNEYLLNGQHVRLKDINELLAQSGLSERTYTILGQGLVDASLALKADERRRLFEEAAGVGLYRTRREEALRRLETTQRNLDRVLDILAELEPRLKSLERQAKRAQEFAQVQSDLRILLLDWYGYHWHRSQKDLVDAMELGKNQDDLLQEARNSYQNIREKFTTFRDNLNSLRARLNSWHRQSSQLHEDRESMSGELAMLDERQRTLLDNRQSGINEQSQLIKETTIARDRLSDAETETKQLQNEFDEAIKQNEMAQNSLDKLLQERIRYEESLQNIRQKLEKSTIQRANLNARLGELKLRIDNQEKEIENLSGEISSMESEIEKSGQDLQEKVLERQKAEKEFTATETDLKLAKNQLSDLEEKVRKKLSIHSEEETEKARLKAQLVVLEQAEQAMTGYTEGAKLLLDASRTSKLNGGRGAFSAALEVPAELETAISAALGEYTDAVLLESGTQTEQAMSLLESGKTGRVAILPLDWLSPPQPIVLQKHGDYLGVASDLVKTTPEFRPAVDLLLGQVIIVRNRQAARDVLHGQPITTRAVTLKGEVFHATGQVTGGNPIKSGTLSRPREKRELQESFDQVANRIRQLDTEIKELNRQAEASRDAVEELQQKVNRSASTLELARKAELEVQVKDESLRSQRDWQVSRKTNIESEIMRAKMEQEQSLTKLSAIEKEISEEQDGLREQTAALSTLSTEEFSEQVKYWSTTTAVAKVALSDAHTRQDERTQDLEKLESRQSVLEVRLKEINQALEDLDLARENIRNQTTGINTQLEQLRDLIGPAEKELTTAETQEMDLQKMEGEEQSSLARVEQRYNQIQLELGRKQEMLESLRQKIEDDFGLVEFDYAVDVSGPVPLPMSGMVEQLPIVESLPIDLEDNMTRLRAQLRRMGAVNPEAQQEFDTVKERHTFLHSQLEDLRKAEADLHQVIEELDELTRRDFQKTFEAVAEQFHTIFHRLFGGGAARLVLTDPDNLTDTGIDIEARLPGRREQGLSLLSGGERSLTAIALVFSLLKVSPTPVCVLDEVDAMLDEANVGRFRDLLLELSDDTQFIIITHNRNTVQAADVIYGVTMGRDSTSQIISLKLDEVSEDYLK